MRDLADPSVDGTTIAAWARHMGKPVVDPERTRARLVGQSLGQEFALAASQHGNSQAIAAGGNDVTHAELNARAGAVAAGLAKLGVGRQDRVLLIAATGLPEIIGYLAVLRLGATVVLANPTLTSSEIQAMRTISGAEWLIASGSPLVEAAKAGPWREVVGLRDKDSEPAGVVADFDNDDSLEPLPVNPSDTAILAFTSGTTGPPKATPLSHRNLISSIRSVMSAWMWSRSDHLVHSLPISHQHGLNGIHATLLAGSRASVMGAFDAEETLRVVSSDAASVHFGVPAIYQRLLSRLGDDAAGLSSLRLAISGSGPLPAEVAVHYEEVVGAAILERYGTTESGLDVSNPYLGPRVVGSVGLPLPGVEMVVANDSGDVVDEGEVGQVLVRGPQVFSGYESVTPNNQPFIGDWFCTGDLGSVDPETGYLRIVGRMKELIITGGMNVYPQEIVDVLLSQPQVTDAAVVGVPSVEWGEEVVALVAPAELDTRLLARSLSARLAPYKRPKRVVPVDNIPRNQVGKLMTDQLRRLIPPTG